MHMYPCVLCGAGHCRCHCSDEEQARALSDIDTIGHFTTEHHFIHDLQILLQNSAPDASQNGRVFIIDPGHLLDGPSKGHQLKHLRRFLKKCIESRKRNRPDAGK